MSLSTILYEDEYGAAISRQGPHLLEIRWYDSTSSISSDQFNEWLSGFAAMVEAERPDGILVDALSFRMDMATMDGPWRDANIIPRYNAAGVSKFAFLMPDGMPLIGTEPKAEGPAQYSTGYFGRRAAALEWLAI
jgi:hypothetical protein